MIETKSFQEEFLGDYKLIKHLGRDLWSDCFLAEHRFIKKKYHLRVLHEELLNSDTFLGCFQDLIVHLTALEHPGIVKIENVSSSNGRYFLVTSCEDESGVFISLTQYVLGSRSDIKEAEVVAILESIAEVIDYAFTKGVSHGELHPDKILVKVSEDRAQVVIKDFGFRDLLKECFPQALFHTVKEYPELSISAKDLFDCLVKDVAFRSPNYGVSNDRKEDIYAFGALAHLLLSQKLTAHKSLSFLDKKVYEYDWNRFFTLTFSEDDEEISSLSSLIMKKEPRSSVMSIVGDQNHVKDYVDHNAEDFLHTCLKEESAAGGGVPKEVIEEVVKPAFVLVEAQSIDKAMDTSYGNEEIGDEESEDGYSGILHSILAREPVVSQYKGKDCSVASIEPLLTDMVFIEGGEFFRGSTQGNRDEQPVHKIILDGFFMDVHPVTNEQFILFLEYCKDDKDKNHNDLIRFKESRIRRSAGRLVVEPGYALHPVVGVTWYGAHSYAQWVGKRLPTEAEWEIAACSGMGIKYPTGQEIDKSQANFFSSDTTVVKSYPANAVGLYDMAGNVYEWCSDWYGYDYYEHSSLEPYSPKGPAQGVYRVLRGGCWKSLKEDLRVSHRHRNNPGTVNGTYGFRCVRDVR